MPIFGDLRPDGRRRRRRNEAGGRLAGPLPSQRQHRAASSVGGRGATTARPAASAATLGQRTRTHLTNRRQLTAQLGAAPFQGGNLFIGHARNPPSTQHPYCWNRPNSPCATPPTAIPPQKSDVHPPAAASEPQRVDCPRHPRVAVPAPSAPRRPLVPRARGPSRVGPVLAPEAPSTGCRMPGRSRNPGAGAARPARRRCA